MANTNFSSLSFYFCIFLLCHGSMAQLFSQSINLWQSPRRGAFRECRFDRLQALEPLRQVRSQGGLTEYFDEQNEQFLCSGVSVIRRVIDPRGLLLPRYHNAPGLVYIIRGSGFSGFAFPGCPETFQQFEQAQGQSQSQQFSDEHQKVHRFQQGDVITLPVSVAHWLYNDGDAPIVAIYVFDTNNNANQLEPRLKEFLLAGANRGPQHYFGNNIFSGFNTQLLSEALGISEQTTQRLQSQNEQRGEIILVDHGLQFVKPAVIQQTEQQSYPPGQSQVGQYQVGQSTGGSLNGLEQNFCDHKQILNIEDPNQADEYNPRVGRITHLNSQKFSILNTVQMSATRVDLYQNAILSPSWNINAHSVVYMIQGHAWVQVANNQGQNVFNGLLRPGQLLIIPQNYVVLKKAEREGSQHIAFKTNANSMVSYIAGKNSIFQALPTDVIANAYRISKEEAQNLKNNRGEELGAFTTKFPPLSYQSFEGSASTRKASE